MKPTKKQKFAILREILKFIRLHEPSLESYTRDQIGKFIRRYQGIDQVFTIDDFFATVPEKSRTPRSETILNSYYQEMFDRFRDEFDSLDENDISIRPSIAKATPPPLSPEDPLPPKKVSPAVQDPKSQKSKGKKKAER